MECGVVVTDCRRYCREDPCRHLKSVPAMLLPSLRGGFLPDEATSQILLPLLRGGSSLRGGFLPDEAIQGSRNAIIMFKYNVY